MRLWSLHPKYLDRAGLLALWREALLAKKVLEGKTRGYKNHPQLLRFKESKNSTKFINAFLCEIWKEGVKRKYRFNKSKMQIRITKQKLFVTRGQVKYEYTHLLKKLKKRNNEKFRELESIKISNIEINKIFKLKNGKIEAWERV